MSTNSNTTLGAELPHAPSLEKAVLSVMMKRPEFLAEHPLDTGIFYLPAHRKLYAAMREAGVVDLVSFVQRLADRGELDHVGGPSAVTDIFTYAPSAAHFAGHLENLRDRWARRKAVAAAQAAIEAAQDVSDPDAYLTALAGPVTEVFETATAATPPPDPKALANQFLETFQLRAAGKSSPMGIPTGFPEIDNPLRGLHPGHVWVIGAFTSGGKSSLATQIMGNLAREEVASLYLPLEGTVEAAVERSVIQLSRLHHRAVTDPQAWAREDGRTNPAKHELEAIRFALETLSHWMHFQRPANRKASTVNAAIRRARRQHGIKVAFVDYLQLIRGHRERGDNGEREFANISHDLQELAVELGITICVLSQQNAEGDTKMARAIEEDCDRFLSIVQDRDRKSDTFQQHQHILVAKDRHTGHGGARLPLVLNRDRVRFEFGHPSTKQATAPRTRFQP